MKITIKRKYLCAFLVLTSFFTTILFFASESHPINTIKKAVEQVNKDYQFIDSTSYEFADNQGYFPNEENKVDNMTFGSKSLGIIKLTGAIECKDTINNIPAYGVNGNISFTYNYDGRLLNPEQKEYWHLSSDTNDTVNGVKLDVPIKYGALIIEKSYDGNTYSRVGSPVTNFFYDNPAGVESFYTTDGSDIGKGTYYRISFAYETRQKIGSSGSLWWEEDKFDYKNHLEVYDFYLANNSGVIAIKNKDVTLPNPNIEGLTTEMIAKGETLVDNSTTNTGFVIDKLGNQSYEVKVQKNNEDAIIANDFQSFVEDGIYTITVRTKFGKTSVIHITVFSGGEDCGLSVYFDKFIVSGKRLYKKSDVPVYDKNSKILIKSVADYIPMIQGSYTNINTGEKWDISPTRNGFESTLPVGTYQAILYSGNPDVAGSIFKYEFNFEIVDEVAGPRVNYNNLLSSYNLCDYQSKHYEVAYHTTKGGYIFVCFSLDSYKEAFNYAFEIEQRFVEPAENNKFRYKKIGSPNKKVLYTDLVALTEAKNYYAKRNVEIAYFNPNDEFTYRTFDDDLLGQLESLNISKSIKVFPNIEQKNKLIDRQPFINSFEFIKVADFDVVKVVAYCYKNGQNYDLEFNKPVDQQLYISSRYRITETNIYGDNSTYDVVFLKENTSISTWSVVNNGKISSLTIDNNDVMDGKYIINCDSLSVESLENPLDDWSIVTVSAPNVYSFDIKCLLSELKDVEFYKKGKYSIDIIDRIGNHFVIEANVSGKERFNKVKARNNISYTNLYNNIFDNDKDDTEELILDDTNLENAINFKLDFNKYIPSSVEFYQGKLEIAKRVYDDPSSTQDDIDNATKELISARKELIISIDRTELGNILEKYKNLDRKLYVSFTFVEWEKAYKKGVASYKDDKLDEEGLSIALKEINDAYSALILRGDKTELIDIMNSIHNIDCSLYTPNSVEILNMYYQKALDTINNIDALQIEIDEHIELLTVKKSLLVLKADFNALSKLIDDINGIDKTEYTAKSISLLKEDFDAAVKINNDKNSEQSLINAIFLKLKTTFENLEKLGDKRPIYELLNEINEVNYYLYTNDSIRNLKAQYNYVISVINNELSIRQCEDIVENLTYSLSHIRVSVNKLKIETSLKNNIVEDLESYTIESSNRYVKAYNKMKQVLYSDEDVSDETTKNLIEELTESINSLEEDKPFPWNIVIYSAIGVFAVIAILVFIFRR